MAASASGEFLARMDADDICHPARFERQLAFLRTHCDIVAVGSCAMRIDPEGLPINKLKVKVNDQHIQVDLLKGGFAIIHPSAAYFSPSWTPFQADRGRHFSVIVDAISD